MTTIMTSWTTVGAVDFLIIENLRQPSLVGAELLMFKNEIFGFTVTFVNCNDFGSDHKWIKSIINTQGLVW